MDEVMKSILLLNNSILRGCRIKVFMAKYKKCRARGNQDRQRNSNNPYRQVWRKQVWYQETFNGTKSAILSGGARRIKDAKRISEF